MIGHTKRCLQKNNKIFYVSVFVIWLYLPKAMYRPCDLDLWPIKVNLWIDKDPISLLYEFQIDISTNSWEIKYQNMGIGILHVKRRTRQNDVKWRPIVTKFGTRIENMSRTAIFFRFSLTILWELVILVWEFFTC